MTQGLAGGVPYITLTGDVTGSSASPVATTIPNDTVTFAKMQNVATNRLLGRYNSGSGDIEEIGIGTGLTISGGSLTTSGSTPKEIHVYTIDDLPAPSTPPFGTYTAQCHVLDFNKTYIFHDIIEIQNPLYAPGAVLTSAPGEWWGGVYMTTTTTDAVIVNPGVDGYLDTYLYNFWLESDTTAPFFKFDNALCYMRNCYLYGFGGASTLGTFNATSGDTMILMKGCSLAHNVQSPARFVMNTTGSYKARVVVDEYDSRALMPYYCNNSVVANMGNTVTINGVDIVKLYNQVTPMFDVSGCQTNGAIIKISDSQFFMRADLSGPTIYDSNRQLIYTNTTAGKLSRCAVNNVSFIDGHNFAQLSTSVTGLTTAAMLTDVSNYQRQGGIMVSSCDNIPNTIIYGQATGSENTGTTTMATTYKRVVVSGGTTNAVSGINHSWFDVNSVTGFPHIRFVGPVAMDFEFEISFSYATIPNFNVTHEFAISQQTSSGNADNTGTYHGWRPASVSYNGLSDVVTCAGSASLSPNDTLTLHVRQPSGTLRDITIKSYAIKVKRAGP